MSKPKETEQSTATFSEDEEYGSAEERLSFAERIEAIVAHAKEKVQRTFRGAAVRDLSGDANEGITETTFKLLLMQAIMDSPLWDSKDGYPPLRIYSEFEFPGERRADLVIFAYSDGDDEAEIRDLHAHIIEVKYFRTGFMATYSRNHRHFLKNISKTSVKIDAMSADALKTVQCRQKFGGHSRKRVSVQDVLDKAEKDQCGPYMNLMRMKYDDSLLSITSQVVFGVSHRILVGGVIAINPKH